MVVGHWLGGNRKLNGHWQSEAKRFFYTAKKSKTQLTYAASLGNVGGSTSEGTPPSLTTEREKNAWEIWIAFKKLGYSEQAVSGMLGNIDAESGIIPDKEQIGGPAYGLVQWDGSAYPLVGPIEPDGRKYVQNLLKEANISGDYTKNATQIKLLEWCMHNGQWIGAVDPLTVQGFKSETSVNNATLAFLRNFERAGVEALAKRQEQANYWYSKLHGLGNVGGKDMYLIRNVKKGEIIKCNKGAASRVDVYELSGEEMKYFYDNGDLLSSTKSRYFGYQITAYRTPPTRTTGWERGKSWNSIIPGISNLFCPKDSNYVFASYLNDRDSSDEMVSAYKALTYEGLKHDTSQFGNTELVGTSELNNTLMKLTYSVAEFKINTTDKWSGTADVNTYEKMEGSFDWTSSISTNDYKAKEPKKEMPAIGKTFVFATGSYSNYDTKYINNTVYFVTPTIYDNQGKVAKLKHT